MQLTNKHELDQQTSRCRFSLTEEQQGQDLSEQSISDI